MPWWAYCFAEALRLGNPLQQVSGEVDTAPLPAGAMATLRTAALNLLRLSGFQSIRAGMQTVMHDITALLAMAMRQPSPGPS